jgi:spermidine/putrescine transport system substrate-binding protein
MKPVIRRFVSLLSGLAVLLCSGCGPLAAQGSSAPGKTMGEVVIYDWIDDLPEPVMEQFTNETGIAVRYEVYESQEEAIEKMKTGQVFDIVVMDSQFIPGLIESQLLSPINYQNVANFKYVSANFRDLVYDQGNRYSIPYNWGTTGLVLRSDKVKGIVTSWSSLWEQQGARRVLLWRGVERQMVGMTLKSLGFSANSENPAELEAAYQKLLALKPNVVYGEDSDDTQETSAPALLDGRIVMAVGWSNDVRSAREQNPAVTYVLPKEGALLWGDNFVLPANSKNHAAAEVFLNFLLRPEISAQLTMYNFYPTANDKARDFVGADILNDPVIFPKNEELRNAEIILPLSEAGAKLHNEIWERFLAAP